MDGSARKTEFLNCMVEWQKKVKDVHSFDDLIKQIKQISQELGNFEEKLTIESLKQNQIVLKEEWVGLDEVKFSVGQLQEDERLEDAEYDYEAYETIYLTIKDGTFEIKTKINVTYNYYKTWSDEGLNEVKFSSKIEVPTSKKQAIAQVLFWIMTNHGKYKDHYWPGLKHRCDDIVAKEICKFLGLKQQCVNPSHCD